MKRRSRFIVILSALIGALASVDEAVTEPPAPRRRWPLLAACALGAVFVAGLAWAFVNGPADEEADGTTTETSEERDGTTTSLEPDDPEPEPPKPKSRERDWPVTSLPLLFVWEDANTDNQAGTLDAGRPVAVEAREGVGQPAQQRKA